MLLLLTHARINKQIYAKDSSQIRVLKAVSLEPSIENNFRFKHALALQSMNEDPAAMGVGVTRTSRLPFLRGKELGPAATL